MNIVWIWTPLISIGPFYFGETIFKYKDLYQLELVPDEFVIKGDNWDTYELNGYDDARIHCENNKIISIACYKEFYYNGVNLIGKKLTEVSKLLKLSPDEYGDIIYINESPEIPVEFDSVNLQLWCKNEIVVTAFCS